MVVMRLAVLIVFSLFSGVRSDGSQSCSIVEVELCTVGLDVLGREITPVYDNTDLNHICSKWMAAKPCVDVVTEVCSQEVNDTVIHTLEDIRAHKQAKQNAAEWTNGYTYLCNTGKSDYEALVPSCLLKTVNLTQTTQTCYHEYHNKTWWLDVEEPINTYKFCTAAKNLVSCLTTAGEESCGESFSLWVKAYHRQLWSAHLDDIACSLETTFSEGAIAILSICGAAVVVAIICSILSFFIKPHKTNKPEDKTIKASASETDLGSDNKAFANGDMEMNDEGLHKRSNTESKSKEITKM